MRCLAKSQGPKVKYHLYKSWSKRIRVNAILPGLLLSECAFSCNVLTIGGLKYGEEAIEMHKQLSPLKRVTEMDDCAEAFVMMAKNGTCGISVFADGEQIV